MLAAVPHIPHPLDDDVCLLYVGISPARDTSQQTMRAHVIGNHLNGNVGSSTFRFVLAALLIDALELQPYLRGTNVALIEGKVIAQLGPPLNSAANAVHAFYPTVRAARAEFRKLARAAPAPSGAPRESDDQRRRRRGTAE